MIHLKRAASVWLSVLFVGTTAWGQETDLQESGQDEESERPVEVRVIEDLDFTLSDTGSRKKEAENTSDARASAETTEKVSKQETEAQAETPLPGPKYMNLRYDDDFSYLDGPEGSYRKDFFDPIKNIKFGEDWRLSFGGEYRGRLNSLTNTAFGSRARTQDTNFEWRTFLHMDLRYRKLFRFFLQGIHAEIEDNDFGLTPLNENRFDFQQLFVDFRVLGEDVPLTVRFGRQELAYGGQRWISPLDWANTRRRFDGVKVFWQGEKFDVDFFYVKPFGPVTIDIGEILNRKPDEYREEQDFYGFYSTYKGIKNHKIDYYFFALRDTGDFVNANGNAGDISLYTMGGRFAGKTSDWDYEAELSGQWGKFAGDTIQAWAWTVDTGYTLTEIPWTPRIGAGFDYASGDKDPNDGIQGTFNQLYPFGHYYLGFLDLIARQNVLAQNVNLTFKPLKNVVGRIAWHTFWLEETRDALYNAGGIPGRRDRSGKSGREVGHELDITLKWSIDTHQTLLLGYSHFWDSDLIVNTGPSEDPDYLYMLYSFKF